MRNNADRKDRASEKLQQILEEAVNSRADTIEFEYVAEGLEVSMMFGGRGIGYVLDDRELAGEIIGLIIDRARLANKSRGVMTWTLLGKPCTITVEEYDCFGESAFQLKFRKPRRKPT